MNAPVTASSREEGKAIDTDARPRAIKQTSRDPDGCENEFEIKEGMTKSEALEVAFRRLWCRRDPRDLPGLIAAIDRSKLEAVGGYPHEEMTAEALLLQKVSPFIPEAEFKKWLRAASVASKAKGRGAKRAVPALS